VQIERIKHGRGPAMAHLQPVNHASGRVGKFKPVVQGTGWCLTREPGAALPVPCYGGNPKYEFACQLVYEERKL